MPRRYPPAEERFWANVGKTDDCWLWTASAKKGYGYISVDGKQTRAHRYSYILHYGPIPDGLHVLHHCDTPGCVRPEHLWLGTHADNMRDAGAKGRIKWNGHSPPPRRGNANNSTKIRDEDIAGLFAKRLAGATQTELAREYGVSQAAIWALLSRRRVDGSLRVPEASMAGPPPGLLRR